MMDFYRIVLFYPCQQVGASAHTLNTKNKKAANPRQANAFGAFPLEHKTLKVLLAAAAAVLVLLASKYRRNSAGSS